MREVTGAYRTDGVKVHSPQVSDMIGHLIRKDLQTFLLARIVHCVGKRLGRVWNEMKGCSVDRRGWSKGYGNQNTWQLSFPDYKTTS